MNEHSRMNVPGSWKRLRRLFLPFGACLLACLAGGCSTLNPAFLDLVAPDVAGAFSSIDNAPGHVVVAFVNNAEVDERLITFLVADDGGQLELTPAEKRTLRPRMRFRILVTFVNGSQTEIEFVDGSVNLIDQSFDASAFPDLNQNDLDNTVVICDVAGIEVVRTSIEVFVPVELQVYELVETTGIGGTQGTEFQLREQTPPQFRQLQQDQQDDDGNTELLSNIGVRDLPAPVIDPLCGSVIAITLNGVLSVPFLDAVEGNAPSYDREDAQTIAGIGGRYEFEVSVK